jgi:hypothetical protein
MDRRAFTTATLALVFSTRAALADGPAAESLRDVGVATRDGSTFRGELVERVPGDHVTIKLASGELKRFAWTDIVDVVAKGPDGPAAKEKDKDDDAKPPQVHLVVDGERRMILERRQNATEGWTLTIPPSYGHSESWEVACVAPCATVIDAGSIYRVNGDGAALSRDFTLPQGQSALRLHLVPRSLAVHDLGYVLMIVGSVVALLGVAGLVSSPVLTDAASAADLRTTGWVGVGVGAGLFAVGLPTVLLTFSHAVTGDGQTFGSTLPLQPRF